MLGEAEHGFVVFFPVEDQGRLYRLYIKHLGDDKFGGFGYDGGLLAAS